MEHCKNCKHWQMPLEPWEFDDITHDRGLDLEIIEEKAVRNYCKSPKVVFYQRPDLDGACVIDGSEYKAELITGPDFGCVNFEKR